MKDSVRLMLASVLYPLRNAHRIFIPLVVTAAVVSVVHYFVQNSFSAYFDGPMPLTMRFVQTAVLFAAAILLASPYLAANLRNIVQGQNNAFVSPWKALKFYFLVLKVSLFGVFLVFVPCAALVYAFLKADFTQALEGLVAIMAAAGLGQVLFSHFILSLGLQADEKSSGLKASAVFTKGNVLLVFATICLTLIAMRLIEAFVVFMFYDVQLSSLMLNKDLTLVLQSFFQNIMTLFVLTILMANVGKAYVKVNQLRSMKGA